MSLRFLVVVLAVLLGHTAPARAIAPVTVGSDRLFESGGTVIVPVACHRPRCHGDSVSAGGHRRTFVLARSARAYVYLPVSSHARRVRLTLRHHRWRRRLVLPVLHRPDPFRCGYGRSAKVLAAARGARVLSVSHDDIDGPSSTAFACLAGRRYELAEEFQSLSGGAGVYGDAVVTAQWAAVTATSYAREGDVYPSIELRRRPDGRSQTVPLDSTNGSRLQRFVVTDAGAVATTQSDGCSRRATVRLVDAGGERLVDDLPGIDPLSLTVEGETVSWLRDGHRRQVTTSGPPPPTFPDYPYYQNCLHAGPRVG